MSVVSIPERVWGGLERLGCCSRNPFRRVSIPERVWGGLERVAIAIAGTLSPFQSLRGFGVGWSFVLVVLTDPFSCFNP